MGGGVFYIPVIRKFFDFFIFLPSSAPSIEVVLSLGREIPSIGTYENNTHFCGKL